jgi:pilus assembly protein CpaB
VGLRKLQPVILEEEDEPAVELPDPEPAPRSAEMYVRTPAYSGPERRKADRRGMDAVRAEALQKVLSQVEDRNFGGIKERVSAPWRGRMKASRYVLLLVAIVAGGSAAWLATQRDPMVTPAVATQPEPVIVVEPTAKVLVAAQTLQVGERIEASSFTWVDWPEDAVRAEYITEAAAPDAAETMAGYVARGEMLEGEPIRAEKLVPVTGGYLSAVLEGGRRAVSINVMAQAASGGFVVANDRVDVVLTRATDGGTQRSDTIVTNVRVLSVGGQLGEAAEASATQPGAEAFHGEAIATLELDPIQTETVIAAQNMGQLSLVLRSMLDAEADASVGQLSANQAIRLTSPFWTR